MIYKTLHRKLSKKGRENNGQKIKEQRTNNDLQNITQKTIEEGQRKQWSKDKEAWTDNTTTNRNTDRQ